MNLFTRMATIVIATLIAQVASAEQYKVTVQAIATKESTYLDIPLFGITDNTFNIQIELIVESDYMSTYNGTYRLPSVDKFFVDSTTGVGTTVTFAADPRAIVSVNATVGNRTFTYDNLRVWGLFGDQDRIMLVGGLNVGTSSKVMVAFGDLSDVQRPQLQLGMYTCNDGFSCWHLNRGLMLERTEENFVRVLADLTGITTTIELVPVAPPPTKEEMIADLITKVDQLTTVDAGAANALTSVLKFADEAIASGKVLKASNSLNAFITVVNAKRGKQIPEELADQLIADANAVLAMLQD